MSYSLPPPRVYKGTDLSIQDQAILSEEERLVVVCATSLRLETCLANVLYEQIRFGRDADPACAAQDEVLWKMFVSSIPSEWHLKTLTFCHSQDKVKNFAVMYARLPSIPYAPAYSS